MDIQLCAQKSQKNYIFLPLHLPKTPKKNPPINHFPPKSPFLSRWGGGGAKEKNFEANLNFLVFFWIEGKFPTPPSPPIHPFHHNLHRERERDVSKSKKKKKSVAVYSPPPLLLPRFASSHFLPPSRGGWRRGRGKGKGGFTSVMEKVPLVGLTWSC